MGQVFARCPVLLHWRHSLLFAGQCWGLCRLPIAPQVRHCPMSSVGSSESSESSPVDAYLKARSGRVERSLSYRWPRYGEGYLSMATIVSSTTLLIYMILDWVFSSRACRGSSGPCLWAISLISPHRSSVSMREWDMAMTMLCRSWASRVDMSEKLFSDMKSAMSKARS